MAIGPHPKQSWKQICIGSLTILAAGCQQRLLPLQSNPYSISSSHHPSA